MRILSGKVPHSEVFDCFLGDKMLYLLIITDTELCYDNYSEDFDIGLFKSEKEAKETAEYYLKNIAGFCEFPCTYKIVPKDVYGKLESDRVWIVQGWDTNEYFDEINIIESQCCTSKKQAELILSELQKTHKRSEWVIDAWTIGKKEWQEGFCRTEE